MDIEQPPQSLHTPADYLRAASDPGAGEDMLRRLAQSPYPFVWQALASNPHTPTGTLNELRSRHDSTWNDNRLLALIARHHNADRTVLLSVLNAVGVKLGTPDDRPFAAALALADRPELTTTEVERLGTLPGASARLRQALRRRLEQR